VGVPGEGGGLIDDTRLHPVAYAGHVVVMVVVVHQMLHGSGTSTHTHTDPGRRQQRRLLLQSDVHSRLHRLVQTEHHRA